MKLQLPSITAICIDCVNANRAIRVLEHCKSLCDFGDVKLLTSIPVAYEHRVRIKPLNSLIAYSIFMLTKVHEYVNTPHMLILQRDGFIINPSAWQEDWLKYSYIAPLFVQYPRVGSGGFSLRSKKLMEEVSRTTPEWDWTQKQAEIIQDEMGMYEDGVISLSGKYSQFNIAPPEEACNFAQGGNPDPIYYRSHPFGFHGVINAIDHKTGFVSPVCEHGGSSCECVKSHVDYLQELGKTNNE